MPDARLKDPLELDVVLVHGTWGRGFFRKKPVAPWCEPKANLVFQLGVKLSDADIKTQFFPFNWSGNNSIFERANAASDLARFLKSNFAGKTPVLVIAHSHGGNVALQAIAKLHDVSHIHVCTLATPFFRIFESKRKFEGSLPLLRGFAIVTFLAAAFLISESSYRFGNLDGNGILVWPCVAILAGWLVGNFLNRILVNPDSGLNKHPPWEDKPWHLSRATDSDAKLLGNRLFVIRGIDDEASLSLAAGAVTNRLVRFLYNFSITGGVAIAAAIGLLVPRTWFGGFHVLGIFVFPAFAVICLFLPSFVRPIFGRELAFGAARCDALYDSVPDADNARVRTLHFAYEDKQLIHAMYDSHIAPEWIADWIIDHLGLCETWERGMRKYAMKPELRQ